MEKRVCTFCGEQEVVLEDGQWTCENCGEDDLDDGYYYKDDDA